MPAQTFFLADNTFDHSYVRDLEGCYVPWQAERVPEPRLLQFNKTLAQELALDAVALASPESAQIFSGNEMPSGAVPIAQAYSGHQFGRFSPQLGDGRALLLGEVVDCFGQRRDIQLKGCGRTPFSRNGDGKAAVGPMLREYLMGEAMDALGVPTTRALAVVTTGERVLRDSLVPGAVLTRVASSHLRVGTFEFFAARNETARVRQLADYTVKRHYPDLIGRPLVEFLQAVIDRQAHLVARWMAVGFIHGVMNTDNMALSGETIDYGPCAFLEHYDPATVFSSIDQGGRYAYGNQPGIAQWNLARFAETLLPLLDAAAVNAVTLATQAVQDFLPRYQKAWTDEMRRKLGMVRREAGDVKLAQDFLAVLQAGKADYTLSWYALADEAQGKKNTLRAVMRQETPLLDAWLGRWLARIEHEKRDRLEIAVALRCANPCYIPRNHRVEEALEAATSGDMQPFERLLEILRAPYTERAEAASYAQPAAPEQTARYRTFCGT